MITHHPTCPPGQHHFDAGSHVCWCGKMTARGPASDYAPSKSITPALTAEEWAYFQAGKNATLLDTGVAQDREGSLLIQPYREQSFVVERPEVHALAALALHGQPFGFVQQDVKELRMAAGLLSWGPTQRILSIAARIAALLPPEP